MTLVRALLAVGIVAVVPLALRLVVVGDAVAGRVVRFCGLTTAIAAPFAVVSLLLPPGNGTAVLAAAWLAACSPAALAAVIELVRSPRTVHSLVGVAGLAYLVVGAAWLVISRAGIRPLGFPTDIVELTAVHFHFTGLAAAVIAQQVVGITERRPGAGRAGRLAAMALIAGSPITAAGFTVGSPAVQVVGVSLIAGAVMVLAVLVLLETPHLAPGPGAWLLRVSAVSVFVPMILALDFTMAKLVPIPSLGIPAMAAVHGTTNALLFCLCGLIGWHLVRRAGSAA